MTFLFDFRALLQTFKPAFLASCVVFFSAGAHADDNYVGTAACTECHEAETKRWQRSDHFHAMLPASQESVLGDFSQRIEMNRQSYDFAHEPADATSADRYEVKIASEDPDQPALTVRYTFGHRPLQQYLVEMSGGRLQALNSAWDSRPAELGGQRWFHLRQGEPDDSPFHFTRQLQNWNAQCAACHSTRFAKGYDADTSTYYSTFTDVNVGCEACHGPGRAHVDTADSGEQVKMRTLVSAQWRFEPGAGIAQPHGKVDVRYIDTCGGCHSRRAQFSQVDPLAKYADQYTLSLPRPPLYYADGQIRDEVFVLGSFMQSKMYQRGVTCMDCHEPHSGELKRPGNQLCAGCHSTEVYEKPTHLRHAKGSAGAQCVNCHMPTNTYMSVDARRDHQFGVPDPALSISMGPPNACTQCHEDRSDEWALNNLGQLPKQNRFAALQVRLAQLDPLAVSEAAVYIENAAYPAIRRAALLEQLSATDLSISIAARVLRQNVSTTQDDVLLRGAAVDLISGAPIQVRQWLLTPVLADPARSVQLAAIRALVPTLESANASDELIRLLPRYREMIHSIIDTPGGLLELSRLEQALGRRQATISALEKALELEPDFVAASLNLADLYRAEGIEPRAVSLLSNAVSRAPDSGAAQHALGLALVRQQKLTQALGHLRLATTQADRQPRFAYVYAVALDSVDRTAEAVNVLADASRIWPNQYDLLVLEVMYREKVRQIQGIQVPIRALLKLAPNEPSVQRWGARYRVITDQ